MKSLNKFNLYKDSINDLLSIIPYKNFQLTINLIEKTKKNNGKIIIVGNGGSSSIASHISVDFTKVAKIKSLTFNNSNLITCFANDYGYENWVVKALDYHSDPGDMLILISSSGESKNMINASIYANKNKLNLVTLTGFSNKNRLKKTGKINFWVNSNKYNVIENIHQTILLSLVDYFL